MTSIIIQDAQLYHYTEMSNENWLNTPCKSGRESIKELLRESLVKTREIARRCCEGCLQTSDDCRLTMCKHVYCRLCISESEVDRQCPMCRAKVLERVKKISPR